MRTGLDGRVAVVTGAGSGIGLATARLLARENALIVAADVREDGLAELRGELGDDCLPVTGDVADAACAAAIVAAAQRRFGHVDVLVTCAGIYDTATVERTDVAAWDKVMAINLRGTFLCAQAALPIMAAAGWGRIVTLSSVVAFTGGMAAGPAYVASKAGVVGLTRSLAHAGGPHGVTVNCVHPGVIDTPMTTAMDLATRSVAAERAVLGRTGTPDEVAAMIVMLASEIASFVTGAHLSVTGGLVMD